jgi:hypothetical protein
VSKFCSLVFVNSSHLSYGLSCICPGKIPHPITPALLIHFPNLFRLSDPLLELVRGRRRQFFFGRRVAPMPLRTPSTSCYSEDSVKIRFSLIAAIAVLFASLSLGSVAHAQQTPDNQQPMPQTQQSPDTQAPPAQSQPPAQTTPGQTQSGQSEDAAAQSSASGEKEFVGTVVKQGDKYMFQDSASGTTYDIDHQDEVKKFDGKRVRVHGTLDSNGKLIHVQ